MSKNTETNIHMNNNTESSENLTTNNEQFAQKQTKRMYDAQQQRHTEKAVYETMNKMDQLGQKKYETLEMNENYEVLINKKNKNLKDLHIPTMSNQKSDLIVGLYQENKNLIESGMKYITMVKKAKETDEKEIIRLKDLTDTREEELDQYIEEIEEIETTLCKIKKELVKFELENNKLKYQNIINIYQMMLILCIVMFYTYTIGYFGILVVFNTHIYICRMIGKFTLFICYETLYTASELVHYYD